MNLLVSEGSLLLFGLFSTHLADKLKAFLPPIAIIPNQFHHYILIKTQASQRITGNALTPKKHLKFYQQHQYSLEM